MVVILKVPPADCQLADLEINISIPRLIVKVLAGSVYLAINRQYRPARTATTSRVIFA